MEGHVLTIVLTVLSTIVCALLIGLVFVAGQESRSKGAINRILGAMADWIVVRIEQSTEDFKRWK